jgi:hypothetical protein
MNLQEFIKVTFKEQHGLCFRPRIVCNDGFSMSVQGSSGHYCTPRVTQDEYSELEIGYPSDFERSINSYAEQRDTINTVFAYVPCYIIQQIIDKHGGINVDLSK